MTRLTAIFLALLLSLPAVTEAATTFVQLKAAASDGDGSDAIAFDSGIGATTNFLFAHVVELGGVLLTGVSGCSATWSKVDSGNPTTANVELWKGVTPATGACTVTFTWASGPSTTSAVAVYEFSGMGTTPTNGSTTAADCAFNFGTYTCSNYSATAAGVIFHGFTDVNTTHNYSYSSGGFTQSYVFGGGSSTVTMAYKVVAGASTHAPVIAGSLSGSTGRNELVAVYDEQAASTTKSLTLLGVGGLR